MEVVIPDGASVYDIDAILSDKKILPGLWHVPGGGMELTDYVETSKTLGDCWYFAIEKTLKREVMAEVGMEIDRIKYLLDLAFLRPDGVPVITLSLTPDFCKSFIVSNIFSFGGS